MRSLSQNELTGTGISVSNLGKLRVGETRKTQSDREGHFWLPDDIDFQLFITLSPVDLKVEHFDLKPRRWSFDEKDLA